MGVLSWLGGGSFREGGDAPRAMARVPVAGADVGGRERERGSDARSAFGGTFSSVEQNPELVGPGLYMALDEMRLSDPTVRGLMWHVKLPVFRAHWDVEPATDDPIGRTIAEACRWNFGLGERPGRPPMRGGWPTLLRQCALFLDYGAMSQEIVWGRDPVTWVDPDGTPHTLRPIVKVGPRYPQSVAEYLDPPAGSRDYLGGLRQYQDMDVVIPGRVLIHHVLEPENDQYRGTSLLRPCIGPWRLKKNLLISSAIAYDRFSSGIPVVRYPIGAADDVKGKARRIAAGVKSNEQAWVTFEGLAEDGWDLQIVNGAGSIADPIPLLRHYDTQILAAGLAEFAALGITETGSRAVGEVLASPFYLALESFAGQLASDLTDQLVARFVERNFGAQYPSPRLTVSNITASDLDTLGRYVSALAAAGLNVTDRETALHLRTIGKLPPPPEGEPSLPEGSPLAGVLRGFRDENRPLEGL